MQFPAKLGFSFTMEEGEGGGLSYPEKFMNPGFNLGIDRVQRMCD